MTQQTFIFVGRSGCGKGTQSKLLADYLKKLRPEQNTINLSSGAALREFIKGPTFTQKTSKELYDKGGLQPEFLIVSIWADAIIQNYTGSENFIFDGMPRKYHEAGVLDSVFEYYKLPRPVVINLEISNEQSIERLKARGRFDDLETEIKNRLSWYETDVVPMLKYYRENSDKGYKLVTIDGSRSIEEVHKDIISHL